ncbi:pentapeptide repeat-containing protein [Streptomyces sp. NBC_00647]|uniref:pentapeptide repeat-containing protein n=1 Tax=Streptomyces sp. NBC_00647 TaxID=2975796 RepID=UPI00324A9BE8
MTTENDATANRGLPWWGWAAGIVGAGAFLAALIWGPWWIEGSRLRDAKGNLVSSAGIIITGFRTVLVAIVAGILTALGLRYTHQNHQHTVRKDREQADLTREDQVTGRYVEAVKLLASDKLHERLGGIYALERIMKDSERDRGTATEVLSAFARDKTPKVPDDSEAAFEPRIPATSDPREVHVTALPADVRAALNVVGRNWTTGQDRADLRGIELPYTNLTEVNLTGTQLQGAVMRGANLREAKLMNAQLRRAVLDDTQLKEADLTLAYMKWARLSDANMEGVNLRSADLSGALLTRARLRRAHMAGARLDDAYLSETRLDTATGLTPEQVCKARIYHSTRLPEAIAADPRIVARITECEMIRDNGRKPPPPAGEGVP